MLEKLRAYNDLPLIAIFFAVAGLVVIQLTEIPWWYVTFGALSSTGVYIYVELWQADSIDS